jgi:hypothetical protein
MGRSVNQQNDSVTNYIFNESNIFHLGDACVQSPGLSCKSIHGQNKIIDVETNMWKSQESYPIVNPSLAPTQNTISPPSKKISLPFSAGEWQLRESKSSSTISTTTNERWLHSMPIHHPLVQERVPSITSIDLFGVDTRQLIKYN